MDIHPQKLRTDSVLFCTNSGIIILFVFSLFSCRTQRQIQYLEGKFDTSAFSQINIPEPTIQKGDLVGITVYSDNPEATASFNQQMNTSLPSNTMTTGSSLNAASGVQTMPGYLVDAEGNIQVHSLNLLHVEGLTKSQLAKLLEEQLAKYLKNPYCNIRFLNYKFTILGEVSRQGVYSVPGEKINIFEALGMAGDITLYGLKDSIMVIRESNGKRTFGNIDVSNPQIMLSPYYNLQQNDIVIVKANRKKPSVSEQSTAQNFARITTIISIVTSLAVVLNLLLK